MFRAIASRYLPSHSHAINSGWLALAALCLSWLAPAAMQAQTSNNSETLSPVTTSYGNMAVDSNGNIYFPAGPSVFEAMLSGGTYTLSTIITGLYPYPPLGGPSDGVPGTVALDGNGNIYVTSDGYGIFKVAPTGSGYSGTKLSGLSAVLSIAADSSGNLYIATIDGSLTKETLSGSGYIPTTIDSGFSAAFGLTVDSSDNIYVADTGAGNVYKETLLGGSYTRSSIDTGLNEPYGVAVDTSGNVYVSDVGSGIVYEGTSSGTAYTWNTLLTGLTDPIGVGVDGSGNIYVNEGYPASQVLKVTP